MKKLLLPALTVMMGIFSSYAYDFFSTEKPETFFNIGARIGVNTSNRTVNAVVGNNWNHNSWGTGFDAGVVADINIRNFISIQPGFFFESRSGAFAYRDVYEFNTPEEDFIWAQTQLGKGREYFFTIPIMAIGHFNILEDLRWNVEFGPYFQLKLSSSFDGKFGYRDNDYSLSVVDYPWDVISYNYKTKTSKFDFGFKFGTSLDICEHYYVGVHYLAGVLRAWDPAMLGGRNKEWMFTIGYNF